MEYITNNTLHWHLKIRIEVSSQALRERERERERGLLGAVNSIGYCNLFLKKYQLLTTLVANPCDARNNFKNEIFMKHSK